MRSSGSDPLGLGPCWQDRADESVCIEGDEGGLCLPSSGLEREAKDRGRGGSGCQLIMYYAQTLPHNISFHSYNNAFETNIEVPRFQTKTFGHEDMKLKEVK